MNKTVEQVESELIHEIEKSRMIVDNLENNDGYKALVNDFKKAAEDIDANWHLVFDMGKLTEFRITKMAAVTLIGALDQYKGALERAKQQLEQLKDEDNG